MVRPKNFGYNAETAQSNSFQNNLKIDNIASKALEEFDEMLRIIRSNNIQVEVFEDERTDLYDSVFPNNWISHTPEGNVIVYPMKDENRRREIRQDIVGRLLGLIPSSKKNDLSEYAKGGRFLEGTGSIIFDHASKTAFAAQSSRTEIKLFNQLCLSLGYNAVSFESFDLKGHPIYHTNVMLSISEKYAIICLESISNILERVMVKKELEKIGKEIIEINFQQMNSFAANSFEVLDSDMKSCLLMSAKGIASLGKEQKIQITNNSNLIGIEVPNIENIGGGSVRCMVAGLFNYPK